MQHHKPYQIVKVKQSLLIISLSYQRMDTYIHELTQDLVSKQYEGSVLFDLILSNGVSQRFFSAKFSNSKLLVSSLKKEKEVDMDFKKSSAEYFQKHRSILKNGILSSIEMERILFG